MNLCLFFEEIIIQVLWPFFKLSFSLFFFFAIGLQEFFIQFGLFNSSVDIGLADIFFRSLVSLSSVEFCLCCVEAFDLESHMYSCVCSWAFGVLFQVSCIKYLDAFPSVSSPLGVFFSLFWIDLCVLGKIRAQFHSVVCRDPMFTVLFFEGTASPAFILFGTPVRDSSHLSAYWWPSLVMFMVRWRGDQVGQKLFSWVRVSVSFRQGDIMQRRRFRSILTHQCDFQLREASGLCITWPLGTVSSESTTSLGSSLQGRQQWGHWSQGVITRWKSLRKWFWHPLRIYSCLSWRRTGISWLEHKCSLQNKEGLENLELYLDFFFIPFSYLPRHHVTIKDQMRLIHSLIHLFISSVFLRKSLSQHHVPSVPRQPLVTCYPPFSGFLHPFHENMVMGQGGNR